MRMRSSLGLMFVATMGALACSSTGSDQGHDAAAGSADVGPSGLGGRGGTDGTGGTGGQAGADASVGAGGSVGADASVGTGGSAGADASVGTGGSADVGVGTGGRAGVDAYSDGRLDGGADVAGKSDGPGGTGGGTAGAGGHADANPGTGGNLDAGTGSGGSVGADGGGSVDAGLPPTFAIDFSTADKSRFYSRADNGGSVTFGTANASAADNAVAELVFKGSAALGPGDKLNPDFATEIGTNQSFGYGTFRTRVQLAQCNSSEELVNGIFTYFNDGKDHDGDGLIDNSEIDIEILCSDPSIISLTIWSEYTSDTAKQGVSRVIHTKTGAYEDSLNDSTSLGSGTLPALKLTGFPDPNAFYEMGFDWHASSLRYFIVVGGNEITLWTYTDAKYIPSLPAAFLFNVWHSTDWWSSKGTADYPANDAVMRLDWFRYWKE